MKSQFGKYRPLRRLGAGGMGEVWEAIDTVLNRTVAVKLLAGEEADTADVVREASAAAKVVHPNVVALFDASEADGRWFLVLEYVAGPTAAQRVQELGRLPWKEATAIVRDAAEGLAAIHAAGLIHRDVKPSNILLAPDGRAKIADFGLARSSTRSGRTNNSGVVGTPHYMSPEQCWSEAADARTDVYSLGATYFTLLTGHAPFEANNDLAVMYAHCHAAVPDPRVQVVDLPLACANVVRRAMAKQPADRFASAEEFRHALAALLEDSAAESPVSGLQGRGRGPLSRRALLAAVPVSAVAVGLFAYWGWKPGEVEPIPPDDFAGPPPSPPAPREPWLIGNTVPGLAVSPDGQRIAISFTTEKGETDGLSLRTWDNVPVEWWRKAQSTLGHAPEAVAFSPNHRWLAGAYRGSGSVRVWDTRTGLLKTPEKAEGELPGATMVAFTADGRWLVAAASGEARVRVWEWQDEVWRFRHDYLMAELGVWGFALEPEGFRLAVVSADGNAPDARATFHFLDVRTGQPIPGPAVVAARRWIGPTVAFSRTHLAVSSPTDVTLYRLADWTPEPKRIASPVVELWSLAFSPDGEWLAGTSDTKVYLWRIPGGEEVAVFGPLPRRTFGLAFTPDSQTLLSGGDHGHVYFHDLTPFRR